jgi:hypothetical protein
VRVSCFDGAAVSAAYLRRGLRPASRSRERAGDLLTALELGHTARRMSVWQAQKTWPDVWRSTLDSLTGLAAQQYSLTDPNWIAYGAGCLCLWVAIWQYSYESIHTFHGVVVTAMSLASLVELISEEAVYLLSLTYFLLDGADSVRVGKYLMLFAHHFPTLALFGAVVAFPKMLTLRYPSKILLIEVTTPFLVRWRKTKRKDHFQVFMASFFIVRVCYMSWLAVQFHNDIGSWVSWTANALLAVNIFWFCQQCQMLFNYKEKDVAGDAGADLLQGRDKAD